jgi:fatty acid desaturase
MQQNVRILTLWQNKKCCLFKGMEGRGFRIRDVEWPTVAVLCVCYALWVLATAFYAELGALPFIVLAAPLVTLHSSLQHEAAHGHPTRSPALNEALVFLPLGLLYPFRRFKALHLRHHSDSSLTDPYDDPESFYYALSDWHQLPKPVQKVLDFNNTFLGRFTIGPLVMAAGFAAAEFRLIVKGDNHVFGAWVRHAAGLVIVLSWTHVFCGIPFWAYLATAYLGLSILNLRTFAEHQAHEAPGARTVIVEEASPIFGLLFLNNNLHYVHHENPRVSWYRLPALYRADRAAFLAANESYAFKGYGEMIRQYLFRAKAPVPHPLLRRG